MIWELIYKIGVETLEIWKPYTFPSPVSVFETLIDLISDNTLGIAIAASMKRIFIGYSISVCLGIIVGLIMAKFKYLDENLSPLILGMQTLPSICCEHCNPVGNKKRKSPLYSSRQDPGCKGNEDILECNYSGCTAGCDFRFEARLVFCMESAHGR